MSEFLADEALKALQLATDETTRLVVPAVVGATFAGAARLRDLIFSRVTTLPRDPGARVAKIVTILEADPEFRSLLFSAVAELRVNGAGVKVPPGPRGFKDRSAALAELSGPGVRTIIGPVGRGKTYILQQVRHIRAKEYGDGNVFVDCAQFRTDGVLRYAELFSSVLQQLGFTVDETSDAALSARYERALLHGRFLLAFDNVVDVAEARALARDWESSLVLLSTRETFGDLARWHGTTPLVLGGLDDAGAAREILQSQATAQVLDAESAATEALLRVCGNIPDFLHRAGATLRLRRGEAKPVARLVAELRAGQDPQGFDDILTSLGIDGLPAAARADLTVLAGHPGESFTRDSADAFLGHPAGSTIDTLLSAGLAVAGPDGLLRLLELVRQRTRPTRAVRDDALRRLLATVGELADTADLTLEGDRLRPAEIIGDPVWPLAHLSPIEYLDLHAVLIVELVQFAHHDQRHREAIRLCGALEIVLTYHGRHHLVATAIGWGIESAEAIGDDLAAARLYSTRARIETALRQFTPAESSLDIADRFAIRAGRPRLDSSLLEFRSRLARERTRLEIDRGVPETPESFAEASAFIRRALDIDRTQGLDRARGIHARELGSLEIRARRPDQAMTLFNEAARYTDRSRPRNVSRIHLGRARAHDLLQQWEQCDAEIAIARQLVAASGASAYELEIDDLVAESAWHRGDYEAARHGWEKLAEHFYNEAHPRYDRYKAKLRQLPPVPR
jgi:tetratricopeptide (TPR) repeat protein